MRPAIAFYVSGHGYGHATRSAAILAEIRRLRPDVVLWAVTDAPVALFTEVDGLFLRERWVDVGVLQKDSLSLDIPATESRLADFLEIFDRSADEEAGTLRSVGVKLVVGDSPPLAFWAAHRAGLRSVAVGSFTWDWLYARLDTKRPAFDEAIARFSAAYRTVDLYLRLPFAQPASTHPFSRYEDVPLVVRPQKGTPNAIRHYLGLARDPRPIVLMSFGGFGFEGIDRIPFGDDPERVYVVLQGRNAAKGHAKNVLRLAPRTMHHPDLVATSACVVSKLGYGIISETVAAQRPFLAVDRPDFPESPHLLEGLEAHVPVASMGSADLLSGRGFEVIGTLLGSAGRCTPARTDGAAVVAEKILAELDRAV